jgi:hypothetical protein
LPVHQQRLPAASEKVNLQTPSLSFCAQAAAFSNPFHYLHCLNSFAVLLSLNRPAATHLHLPV